MNNRKLEILNAEGKKEIELNNLKYREAIINSLKENPHMIDSILESTELNEQDFFKLLSGETKSNITELDFILKYSLDNKNEKKM